VLGLNGARIYQTCPPMLRSSTTGRWGTKAEWGRSWLSAQAKLLRAIQDLAVERVGGNSTHRIDLRIVAATNRSLRLLVDRQLFRPDLYYRLSGVDIRVPTLRERRAPPRLFKMPRAR
jgi:transcriptional regulator of acetoin/glycerol metabolism